MPIEPGSLDLKALNKKYGEGKADPVVVRLDENPLPPISYFSTGCLAVDWAFGRGVPMGRIIELYGPTEGGKTALALGIAGGAQQAGEDVLYIDAEHRVNPQHLSHLDPAKLFFSQPIYGEQAWDIAEEFIHKGVGLVVVDSIATMTPRAEAEASMEEQQRGALSRMMGKAMRKISPLVADAGCTLVCINQVRASMDQYTPEVQPGGKALPFHASIRARVSRAEHIKEGTQPIGQRVKVKTTKNTMAPVGRESGFTVWYGGEHPGIDQMQGLLDAAEQLGLLQKKGAYLYYEGVVLGQGAEKAKAALREDAGLVEAITSAVKERLNG